VLAEGPHQFPARVVVGADRIAHGHPAAPFHVVHDEGAVVRREHQHLVAHEGEVCLGGIEALHQRHGPCQIRLARKRAPRPRRADEVGQGEQHHHGRGADQRAKGARRAAMVEAELPPEVVAVFDVLEAEEHQPGGAGQYGADGQHPPRRERGPEERRPAVEMAMGGREGQGQQGE